MRFEFNTPYKSERDYLGSELTKYELTEKDIKEIIKYLTETYEQIEKSLADENFDGWTYNEPTTENAKNFVAEICDFTIGWKYGDQEIVDLDKRIIKQLERSL